MLPEFAKASTLPAAAGFGTRFWLADEGGEMRSDKSGDRLPMTFETETDFHLIGDKLEVGRFLQRDKILEELDGSRWPICPVVPTGEVGAERRAAL